MNRVISYAILLSICFFVACSGLHQQSQRPVKEGFVGGTPESAGYTYSVLLKKYVRLFEDGVAVLSATDSTATSAGYILFDKDSSRAELSIVECKVPLLDRHVAAGGTTVWGEDRKDSYAVERIERGWTVVRNGRLLYTTTGMDTTVAVQFAVKGKTDKIEACFFNLYGLVQLRVGAKWELLRQYPTGSGYGYANASYDLRGKGREATLTHRSNDSTVELREVEP